MEYTLTLAKIIGTLFLVMGISLPINKNTYEKIIADLANSIGTLYFARVMTLMMGLILVYTHNIWQPTWVIAITVLGWIWVFKGVAFLLFPNYVVRTIEKVKFSPPLYATGIIFCLVYGGFLSLKGFALI